MNVLVAIMSCFCFLDAFSCFRASTLFADVEVLTVAVQDGYGEDICVGGNFSGAVTMFPKTVLRQRGGLFKTGKLPDKTKVFTLFKSLSSE